MRAAGHLLALTMQEVLKRIEPGAKDGDIDGFAEEFIRSHGALPAFKGYNGYPKTLCMSFNEQVVHGIPGNRRIKQGDLIGIDCGVILDEYYSDMARSVYVGGEPPRRVRKLMEVTERALERGTQNMVEGKRLGDVSAAVQAEVEAHGFSVVRALVGHGIGTRMHEEPQVPNYGSPGTGPEIRNGMVFAIEPMVNMGRFAVKTLPDGWTIVTADKSLSCHFENTVAATPDGPEILSRVQPEANL
jgi:methionyl aminopeptidase